MQMENEKNENNNETSKIFYEKCKKITCCLQSVVVLVNA